MQNGLYIHATSRIQGITAREVRFQLFQWKRHLERLCKLAYEMNFEVITKNVDFDTYKNQISVAGRFEIMITQLLNCWKQKVKELLEIKQKMKNWSKNLKDVPATQKTTTL